MNAAKIFEMSHLVRILNEATKAYDEGRPKISDFEWDNLYFELEKMEKEYNYVLPDSPTHNITYEVVSKLEKVEHNHKMLSLAKTKDWDEFLKYFGDHDVIGMVKVDGLTCSLRYLDGKLVSAETRGNGLVGEDILHNIKVIKSIPKQIDYKDELIIDGEIICKYNNFEPFKNEYKNPRNFASGSIRLLDSKECEKRNLSFILWNIVKGFDETNSFLTKLQKIGKLGFEVVPWTSSFDWDAKEFLINQAKELYIPIDGLVGRFDELSYGNSLGETAHHSNAAYAFKFYDDEYETELLDIEWTMGRTGILTPVAVFKPVEIDGSIVERASLHNVSIMEETLGRNPFKYQKINVAKMNMIIPQITSAEDSNDKGTAFFIDKEVFIYPNICPICGGPTSINKNDNTSILVCLNPDCDGKLINKLDHFCGKKGLDIKGLSKATLEKIIDWEWVNNFTDIACLKNHRIEWCKKPGFGPKSVDKILDSIDFALNNTTLENFIAAIGIPLIGTQQSKELVKKFNTWESFREAVNNKYNFSKLYSFAEEKTNKILNYNYTEADNVYPYINITPVEKEVVEQNLKGINVCITGKLNIAKNRDELTSKIEQCGGKVASSVSSKTNYLISNEESESSKTLKAKELGIEIITEKDFYEKYLTL